MSVSYDYFDVTFSVNTSQPVGGSTVVFPTFLILILDRTGSMDRCILINLRTKGEICLPVAWRITASLGEKCSGLEHLKELFFFLNARFWLKSKHCGKNENVVWIWFLAFGLVFRLSTQNSLSIPQDNTNHISIVLNLVLMLKPGAI